MIPTDCNVEIPDDEDWNKQYSWLEHNQDEYDNYDEDEED